MATIRPNAEPAATALLSGDIFLIDGATGVRALAGTAVPSVAPGKVATIDNSLTLAGTDGKTVTYNATTTFGGVDGKTFTLNNSLTFAGTDGTTMTFQGTDTYVGRATTDTLTNKTFDTAGAGNAFKINGVTITANTGTGSNVLATSPTLITPVLGVATATSINGATVSPGHHSGEPSNGNAAAGEIGEYIESVIAAGSAVSLVSGAQKDVTTISLSAGDWDVSGVVNWIPASGTTYTNITASISLTANTNDITNGRFTGFAGSSQTPGAVGWGNPVGPLRFSLTTPTTIHLIAGATFGTSTMSAYGLLRARRAR